MAQNDSTRDWPGILTFEVDLHRMIWGGDAIAAYKGVVSDAVDVGESWEVSAVPGKESVVADGSHRGKTLGELTELYGARLIGRRVYGRYGARFPLLVKFIDARRDLSVQVHPDDEMALERHNSLGKTEMWYVIDTRPGALIHVGLNESLTPAEYERRVADGSITRAICSYESHAGDSYFIPAGRVHAIGAGNLLAEIQESSDITYRIYDYGRLDKDGHPRQLHTAEAADAIDYRVNPDGYRNEPVELGDGVCRVAGCDHFTVDHIALTGEHRLAADPDSFTIVICLDGELTVACGTDSRHLSRGHTLLVPASDTDIILSGHASLLTAKA